MESIKEAVQLPSLQQGKIHCITADKRLAVITPVHW